MQLCNFAHKVPSQKKALFKVSHKHKRKRYLLISKIILKASERSHLNTMSWTVFPRIYTSLKSSPTAHNFSNSRPIYVILWGMRNHYQNIWFMKNSECQHFLFLKKQPQNGQIFQLFILYSKGRHFSITKLDILIFCNILYLEIDFWKLS